jgi:hypothetical protein
MGLVQNQTNRLVGWLWLYVVGNGNGAATPGRSAAPMRSG